MGQFAKLEENLMRKRLQDVFPLLNAWLVGPGSARSEAPGFRQIVEDFFDTKKCQLSAQKEWSTTVRKSDESKERGRLVAAHLWPKRGNAALLEQHLGVSTSQLRTGRNGLLLCSGIEKAFDALQLTFVLEQGQLVCRVLDKKIAQASIFEHKAKGDIVKSTRKQDWFETVEGKALHFKTSARPFHRILWLHAICALTQQQLNGWEPLSPLAVGLQQRALACLRRMSNHKFNEIEVGGDETGDETSGDDNDDANFEDSSSNASSSGGDNDDDNLENSSSKAGGWTAAAGTPETLQEALNLQEASPAASTQEDLHETPVPKTKAAKRRERQQKRA